MLKQVNKFQNKSHDICSNYVITNN